jgi:uncharacterized protein (DUF433 family)
MTTVSRLYPENPVQEKCYPRRGLKRTLKSLVPRSRRSSVIFVPLTPRKFGRKVQIVEHGQIITIEPGKRGGQPCISGMRITVRDILEYLAGGMSVDEVLADFPELTIEDIRACLAFAASQMPRPAA